MSRNICVIGTGYVGLIAAVGLADFGNTVTGVDIDISKVELLNKGVSPIYEPGIEEYISRNIQSKRLTFIHDIAKAVQQSEVIFVAVGTPPKENGEADLSYIESVVNSISKEMDHYKIIVTKSTVPVGTNRKMMESIEQKTGKKAGQDFDVVSNPEFLREGKALQDFFHPDRTVIGYESEKSKKIMEDVYRSLNLISVPFVWCGLETAELIKYASNAFLATKITFINEMANLAETVGADIHKIAKSMGMDGRISSKFLHPGPGYGGSCFPKDTRALVMLGDKYDINMSLVKSVVQANELQKKRMVLKLARLFDHDFRHENEEKLKNIFSDKIIAVLGLAFKPETDDIRETPALTIIDSLLNLGAVIRVHDPKAMNNFKTVFSDIKYCSTSYEALENSDAVVILTDWNEYRNLDLDKAIDLMRDKIILDTRNLLDPDAVRKKGFTYSCVGRI